MASLRVVAVLLLVVAFGAGACGGDSPTPGQIGGCLSSERAQARYLVVRAAYEWGVLGERDDVIRSTHPKVRNLIFDPAGELRDWEEMEPPVRGEFLDWATTGEAYARTKDAQTRAFETVTREDCEKLLRD